jgi:hypothetical protein
MRVEAQVRQQPLVPQGGSEAVPGNLHESVGLRAR